MTGADTPPSPGASGSPASPAPPAPPALSVWLLAHLLPEAVRESLMGDLEELFREIERTRGARTARGWYRTEALRALCCIPQLRQPHYPRSSSLPAPPLPTVPRTQPTPPGDGPLANLLTDLRHALRMIARRPWLTLLIVGTLAIGIGATTAIFSVVNPILFQPVPYPHSERIVTVWQHVDGGGRGLAAVTVPATATFGSGSETESGDRDLFGFPTYDDIARAVRSFEHTAAVAYETATLTGASQPELLVGQGVSWEFFRVLGVQPALGRDFTSAEDVRYAAPAVILGNGLWRRRFGGDSTIVGRAVTLDGAPVTVVGVMPAGFESVMQPDAQIWTPLRYDTSLPWACRNCNNLRVIARLRPDATASQAAQELKLLYQNLLSQYPDIYSRGSLSPLSLHDQATRDARPVLLAVLGAVLLVLLIACVNVMNLLLAQGVQRRGEFAVRTALGAGRARLVRQMLTESIVLAAMGGVLGVGIAVLGVRALAATSPPGLPLLDAISVNEPVLLFALILTTSVGIAFGLVPALQAARSDIQQDIRDTSGRTVGAALSTRTALVVSEVALAFILLIGSGLLLRSLGRLFAVQPGFDPTNVLTMQVQTGGSRFGSDSVTRAYFEQLLAAARAVPGVESAALTSQLPLSGEFDVYGLHSESHPNVDFRLDPTGFRYTVSDGYLSAMRIPVLRGRDFTSEDRDDRPMVALINAKFARDELWSGEDPMGQRVRIGPSNQGPWVTIVGVVGDVKQQSLAAAGIYGVLAGTVRERRREIGVRSALGASRRDILSMVLRQGLMLTAIGIVVGGAGALALSRAINGLIFGVSRADPVTYAGVTAMLALVALVACWIPAKYATRVDPTVVLRSD